MCNQWYASELSMPSGRGRDRTDLASSGIEMAALRYGLKCAIYRLGFWMFLELPAVAL